MSKEIITGIIVGAASAALGTIVVLKFFNPEPDGGGQPRQADMFSYTARAGRIAPAVPYRLAADAAPLVQNTPITDAAYNTQPTEYDTTLGPEQNVPGEPLTLPM